jgi:apolipoprotein N-acyltransferase
VALEMIMARFLGGFPWGPLGVSQYQLVPLIQIASVTGVYGVSFLVVWSSLSFLSAGLTIIQRPVPRSWWVAEIFLPTLVVALAFNLGFRQIRQAPPPARTLEVTLVQPSIPQTLIWNSDKNVERFQGVLRLCEAALINRTDLLILPESAIPELLRYDEATARAVLGLARRHRIWMIVDADDFKPHENATRAGDGDFYNCSFLIDRDGKLADQYRKRSLVIFGEYIPLARWLPFLKWFTPIQGGYTPGDRAAQFHLDDLDATVSPLICFEDVFPQIGRGDVQADTDFLVNLTNDGWFGRSAAQWQQAASGLFRAVENGVPLIRCTNNGLTCLIDPQGRIRQIFRDPSGSIYGSGFITLDLPLPPPGQTHTPTFYNRHGDLFGWTCTAIAGLVLAWALLGPEHRTKET